MKELDLLLNGSRKLNLKNEFQYNQRCSVSFQDLSSMVSPLACHINGDVMKNIGGGSENSRKVNCLVMGEGKKSDEVYLPFSFIKTYFDVSRIKHEDESFRAERGVRK